MIMENYTWNKYEFGFREILILRWHSPGQSMSAFTQFGISIPFIGTFAGAGLFPFIGFPFVGRFFVSARFAVAAGLLLLLFAATFFISALLFVARLLSFRLLALSLLLFDDVVRRFRHASLVIQIECAAVLAPSAICTELFLSAYATTLLDTNEVGLIVGRIFKQFTIVQTVGQCLARRPIGGAIAVAQIVRFVFTTLVNGVVAAERAPNVFLAIDGMRVTTESRTIPARHNVTLVLVGILGFFIEQTASSE